MPLVMPQESSMVLTGSNYKKMRPRAGRRDEIFFDEEVSALALRVYASGSGRWLVQYRPRGVPGRLSQIAPKRIVIGDRQFTSLSQARAIAIQTLAAIGRGADPVAEKVERRRRDRNNVAAVLALYEADLERRRIVNRRTVMSTLRRGFYGHLGADLGALKLVDLVEITRSIEQRSGRGAAQDFRSRSSSFLSFAASRGTIPVNPWAGYRQPRRSRAERVEAQEHGRVLTDAEIKAIWAAAKRRNDSFGRLIRFLILSGARRSEASCLRRAWLKERSIDLPAAFTKQARGHSIPRTAGIECLLQETPHRGPLLWPTERRLGGATPISGWSDLLLALIRDAQVSRFTLHDLRRTFRTWAESEGFRDAIAEAALGHVDENTLKRVYARPAWQAELIELFERWSSHIERVTGEAFSHGGDVESKSSPNPGVL
jgi:integrase